MRRAWTGADESPYRLGLVFRSGFITRRRGDRLVAPTCGTHDFRFASALLVKRSGLFLGYETTLGWTNPNQGEKVKISGFGNFAVRSKHERVGRNPHTDLQSKIKRPASQLVGARRAVPLRLDPLAMVYRKMNAN